jgi:hypothetical protein
MAETTTAASRELDEAWVKDFAKRWEEAWN